MSEEYCYYFSKEEEEAWDVYDFKDEKDYSLSWNFMDEIEEGSQVTAQVTDIQNEPETTEVQSIETQSTETKSTEDQKSMVEAYRDKLVSYGRAFQGLLNYLGTGSQTPSSTSPSSTSNSFFSAPISPTSSISSLISSDCTFHSASTGESIADDIELIRPQSFYEKYKDHINRPVMNEEEEEKSEYKENLEELISEFGGLSIKETTPFFQLKNINIQELGIKKVLSPEPFDEKPENTPLTQEPESNDNDDYQGENTCVYQSENCSGECLKVQFEPQQPQRISKRYMVKKKLKNLMRRASTRLRKAKF